MYGNYNTGYGMSPYQQQLAQQAQSANIIGQLRPTPTPAYLTCSPYESNIYASRGFYGNGWFNNGCCNNGCGCC